MATIISIASNLALLLAKKGKRVTLAGLDVGGADIHILFGLMNPPLTLTDFLNHRLDLYRFIKLAAIRPVLSSFLARRAMADALSDRDFSSVEEVLDVVGQTDEMSRGVAETALRTFHPTLILNRLSGRAHVNGATLKKILKEYIGGDLTLLREIPDDPAWSKPYAAIFPSLIVSRLLPPPWRSPPSPIPCSPALLPLPAKPHRSPDWLRRPRNRSAWV